jgi:hypothetical protein
VRLPALAALPALFANVLQSGRCEGTGTGTAAAIRQVFEESGEFSAAVELRRHFPGIADNATARSSATCDRGVETTASPAPEVNSDMSDQTIDTGMTRAVEESPDDLSKIMRAMSRWNVTGSSAALVKDFAPLSTQG